MGSSEYYMPNKPKVRLHPAVYSAMHAFCNREGKKDHRDEKGFLLVGTIDPQTLVADVQNVIIFPQTGNGTAVDFDNTHPATPKFWPAVHDYLARTNQVLLGWAHYYWGGVHHSHMDNFTDDVFSFASKEAGGSPLMLSMTWNNDKAGIEGKLWAKAGNQDVQLTFNELPFEYVTPDQGTVVERFLTEMATKVKVSITFDFDGCEYAANPEDIGLTAEQLKQFAISDLRTNLEQYLAAKNVGDKLRKKLSAMSIDPEVVASVGDQLDKFWRPTSGTIISSPSGDNQKWKDYRDRRFPSSSGGESSSKKEDDFFRSPTQTGRPATAELPSEGQGGVEVTSLAHEVVYQGRRYFVLLEDELSELDPEEFNGRTNFLVVEREYERAKLLQAMLTDTWDKYTRNLFEEAEFTSAQHVKYAAWVQRQRYQHIG